MQKRNAEVNKKSCVACGECVHVCPRNAVWIDRGKYASVDLEKCIGCGLCAKNCPVGCIMIIQKAGV